MGKARQHREGAAGGTVVLGDAVEKAGTRHGHRFESVGRRRTCAPRHRLTARTDGVSRGCNDRTPLELDGDLGDGRRAVWVLDRTAPATDWRSHGLRSGPQL